MYTTFGSFKTIGACGSGRSRFLDVLGGSTRNLPEGQHTRLPVWFPLIMNPGSDDELSWIFKSQMAYTHDETMFRDFFERTRHNVARTCAIIFVSLVARDGDGPSYNRTDIFKLSTAKIRLNNSARMMVTIGLYHACVAALRGECAYDGPEIKKALRDFETVGSNMLKFPGSVLNIDVSDLEPDFGKGTLTSMWPLWNMVVSEAHEGPFATPIFAQKYYVHAYLNNAHSIATWAEGTQVKFGAQWDVSDKNKDDDNAITPAPRLRGRASMGAARRAAMDAAAKASAKEKEPKKKMPVKLPETREEFEALADYALNCFPGTYRVTYKYTSEESKDKKADEAPAEKVVKSASPRGRIPTSSVRPTTRRSGIDMLMQDPEATDEEYAAHLAELTTLKEPEGKVNDDQLPRYLRSASAYILNWVHCTFDTGAFFSRLRFLNEFAPPPEGITVEWLRTLSAPVNTAVLRDDDGRFVAGTVSFRSPRLMAAVMDHMRTLQLSGRFQESDYVPLPVISAAPHVDQTNVVRLHSMDEAPEEPRPGDGDGPDDLDTDTDATARYRIAAE